MSAKEKSEEADRIEKLRLMVTDYVSDVGSMESLPTFLKSREGKEIDKAMQIPDPNGGSTRVNVAQMGEYYYMITEEENGQINIERLNTDLGNIEGGITLATPENFKESGNGTMTFNPGERKESTLVFSDVINDEFCFDIRSGTVTIYIDNNMTLTNKDLKDKNGNPVYRSAINIEPNAKLNLYIAKDITLTVDSGYGQKGDTADGFGAKGGPGGFAGIRVPWIDSNNNSIRDEKEQAELNLYGEGTLIAIGGDAGDGGGAVTGNTGGRRRSVELEQELGATVEKVEMLTKQYIAKLVLGQILMES